MQAQGNHDSIAQITTAACRHMLSHISVQELTTLDALYRTLSHLLPGGEASAQGSKTAVLIIDCLSDILPSPASASSKRARYIAQAQRLAAGRLLRRAAAEAHCAVLVTCRDIPAKEGPVVNPVLAAPRFDGVESSWSAFQASTLQHFAGAGTGARSWSGRVCDTAAWAYARAQPQTPHALDFGHMSLLVQQLHMSRPSALSCASVGDSTLQAAAVRAPHKSAQASSSWSHLACIIKRVHVAASSNARLASLHVGYGLDASSAGQHQLPMAAAALAEGDVRHLLSAQDAGGSLPQWHAREWHESLLDMGVAATGMSKVGPYPPVQPTTTSITEAASAWSARKAKTEYDPPRVPSRQGKFARVGAPPLRSVQQGTAGRGFWAMRAAALGLLQSEANTEEPAH